MAKTPKPEISLDTIIAAGKAARQHPVHPWDSDQFRERLNKAGATWNMVEIVSCPPEKRKALISDFEHHPSWWKAKVSFCAALPVRGNLTYSELGTACEALGWPRPSHIDDAGRLALFALLDDRESVLWAQIRTQRAPPAPPPVPAPPPAPPPPAAVPMGSLFVQARPSGDPHDWHRNHPEVDDVWSFGPASGWRWKVIAWQAVSRMDRETVSMKQIPEEGNLRILAMGPEGKSYETYISRDSFARSLICAHLVEPVQIASDVAPAFTAMGLDFTGNTGVLFGQHSQETA